MSDTVKTENVETTVMSETVKTYTIDPAHSRLGFTVRHMGFSKVRGAFEKFEGVVNVDPADLNTLFAEGTVQSHSITTNDASRDEHLRSADFFESDKYPTITFRSTGVKQVSGSSFTLAGDLTMHGVTKHLELEGEFSGEGIDPWGGTRVGFEARGTINRKDFGLNWNALLESGGFLVSDRVEIELDVQAVLQQ